MLPIEYCYHVPYCNCFIISNLENMQKSKGYRSKIVKNRVFFTGKTGYTRTRVRRTRTRPDP